LTSFLLHIFIVRDRRRNRCYHQLVVVKIFFLFDRHLTPETPIVYVPRAPSSLSHPAKVYIQMKLKNMTISIWHKATSTNRWRRNNSQATYIISRWSHQLHCNITPFPTWLLLYIAFASEWKMKAKQANNTTNEESSKTCSHLCLNELLHISQPPQVLLLLLHVNVVGDEEGQGCVDASLIQISLH